ncbi:MAG: hypothetical protein HXY36_05690 [Chloroflexi bacterium]|nr:hypothetical protein [Chloroflexota bacterium]
MIKGKNLIKFVRRLGITLLFLPEPFTTPFGVALVLVSRYLSRRREASRNSRLREMVKYYLAHTTLLRDNAADKYPAPGSLMRPGLREKHAILGQITGSRSLAMDTQKPSQRYKAGDSFKVESGWPDTSSRAEKVIHHTINREWLSRCYEGAGSTVAHSNWASASGAVERVTQHSINVRLLSQRYKTGRVEQVKVQHHTINMESLLQRYGSAVSSMTVLKALQNNNYYYDIVSRGNVIGGY